MNGNGQEQPVTIDSLSLPAADAIIIHRKIRIVDVNQTFDAIFGYNQSDLPDITLLDLIVPDGRSIVLRNTLIKYDKPYEAVGLRKDGSIFPIEIIDQPVGEQDDSIRAMAIKVITRHKQPEEVLAVLQTANQDLEKRLNRTTTQLRYANERLQLELDERTQIEAALEVRARQQAAVAELGQRALAGAGLAFLMNEAATSAANILKVSHVAIFELTPAGELLLQAGVGWPGDHTGQITLEVKPDSPVGYVFKSGQSVIIEDLETETRFRRLSLLREHHLVSAVNLVIRGREQPFGVLGVYTTRPRRFTEDDLHFLQSIANILAMTIERKQSDEQIKASIREKEVLLREIHDRVKNNLQVIISLLNLQSGYVEDTHAQQILQNILGRIRSMALVHEKLYYSESLAQIDFSEYITDLVAHLFRAHQALARNIKFDLRADQTLLTMETAVPCGLIINELVNNALTHAFPNGHGGQIRLEFMQNVDGRLNLTVTDNGIGYPAGLDFRETPSLGLQIVITLVDQLDGTIERQPHEGTAFKIEFTPEQRQLSTSNETISSG